MASRTVYSCGCAECGDVFYPCEQTDHQDYIAMQEVKVTMLVDQPASSVRWEDIGMDNDGFTIKDSGERQQFGSGMMRDITEGKVDWHRTADGPMLKRWAVHLTKGKEKYPDVKPGIPNWTLASGEEEFERFRQSAYRHFMAWFYGERDEDHAAACVFNLNGAEYVRDKAK